MTRPAREVFESEPVDLLLERDISVDTRLHQGQSPESDAVCKRHGHLQSTSCPYLGPACGVDSGSAVYVSNDVQFASFLVLKQ